MGNKVPYTRAETLTDADKQKLEQTPLSVQASILLQESGATSTAEFTFDDGANWDANTLTYTYDAKALFNINDATVLAWEFLDVDNGFEKKGGSVSFPSLTQVQISFEIPPGASTYRLKGTR